MPESYPSASGIANDRDRHPSPGILRQRHPSVRVQFVYDDCVKQETEATNDPTLDEGALGWALCFEAGLGLLALALGLLTAVWPAAGLDHFGPSSIALGVVSAAPLLAIMLGLRRVSWQPLRGLRQLVDEKLTPMFRGLSMLDVALLSFAAGWGEELLFRGLIQGEIAHHTNIVFGIVVASLVFAFMHFLSLTYFVMAFVVSIYFGWLYWMSGSLWVPIIGHAVYDFAMLVFLQRDDEQRQNESAPELRLFDGDEEVTEENDETDSQDLS